MSTSVTTAADASASESLFSSVSSFFSSLLPVAHADEGKDDEEAGDEEEEEEEEPEDPAPAIHEECENSKPCAPAKHHFEECQKRVETGQGYKGEDCVEEL